MRTLLREKHGSWDSQRPWLLRMARRAGGQSSCSTDQWLTWRPLRFALIPRLHVSRTQDSSKKMNPGMAESVTDSSRWLKWVWCTVMKWSWGGKKQRRRSKQGTVFEDLCLSLCCLHNPCISLRGRCSWSQSYTQSSRGSERLRGPSKTGQIGPKPKLLKIYPMSVMHPLCAFGQHFLGCHYPLNTALMWRVSWLGW